MWSTMKKKPKNPGGKVDLGRAATSLLDAYVQMRNRDAVVKSGRFITLLSRALRIRFAYIEVSVIIVPALVLGSVGIKLNQRNRKMSGQIRNVSNHYGHCMAMVVCHRKHLFHCSCG